MTIAFLLCKFFKFLGITPSFCYYIWMLFLQWMSSFLFYYWMIWMTKDLANSKMLVPKFTSLFFQYINSKVQRLDNNIQNYCILDLLPFYNNPIRNTTKHTCPLVDYCSDQIFWYDILQWDRKYVNSTENFKHKRCCLIIKRSI